MCVCVYSGVKASFPSTSSSAVKCLKSHDIPCIWPDSYGKYLLFLLQTLRPVLSVFYLGRKNTDIIVFSLSSGGQRKHSTESQEFSSVYLC